MNEISWNIMGYSWKLIIEFQNLGMCENGTSSVPNGQQIAVKKKARDVPASLAKMGDCLTQTVPNLAVCY